ncbi:hypothetical protein, partial [Escherichia coli]|uniref:hypothetical protein n=1 Tax=Escherichia coli TaxID=562 RepID=UPI00201B22C1
MSKKLGFALSGLMLAMVAGTASADMDGGQLNISGLVVDNTCETRVDGGNKDGLILLQTATVGEIDAGVLNDTVGAKAKEGANKQVISSQADSLIKISRIWADFFPANTSN